MKHNKNITQLQFSALEQLNSTAVTATIKMQQALNNRMNSFIHSYKIVAPYRNLALGLGSCLEQCVLRGYEVKAKALASCINLNQIQASIPGIASGVLNNKIILMTLLLFQMKSLNLFLILLEFLMMNLNLPFHLKIPRRYL